jgi:hypothetical protein
MMTKREKWIAAILLAISLSPFACMPADAHEFKVEPYMMLQHISAAFKGDPYNKRDELTMDQLALCGTLTHARAPRWEVDLCEGYKWGSSFDSEESTTLTVRYYFGRGR